MQDWKTTDWELKHLTAVEFVSAPNIYLIRYDKGVKRGLKS